MSLSAVVNTLSYIPFVLTEADGITPVTGKVNANFTKTAYLASTPATTATPTVTEVNGGDYVLSFTPSTMGVWFVRWSVVVSGDTVPYAETVQVVTAAQADPAAALSATFSAVTFTTSVDPLTSRIAIHQGDDETLPWTVTSPDITGASATLRIFRGGTDVLTKAASISGTTITVSLTAAETAGLSLGTPAYKYELIATLSGGGIKTVTFGECWVLD